MSMASVEMPLVRFAKKETVHILGRDLKGRLFPDLLRRNRSFAVDKCTQDCTHGMKETASIPWHFQYSNPLQALAPEENCGPSRLIQQSRQTRTIAIARIRFNSDLPWLQYPCQPRFIPSLRDFPNTPI